MARRRTRRTTGTIPPLPVLTSNGALKSGECKELTLPELFDVLHKIPGIIPNGESHGGSTCSWNGNLSYSQALDFAEFGWPDAPLIERIAVPDVQSMIEEDEPIWDVAGGLLDVPTYLSHTPECFSYDEPVQKPARLIRLAVEIGGLQNVSETQLQNRGEAIIAIINSLQLAGHSVELNIVRAWSTNHYDTKPQYSVMVRAKDAGQVLDIQRLQFMIGHPAFYRRLLFGISEWAQGASMRDLSTYTKTFVPNDAGIVHIPYNSGLYEDADTSMAWARAFADGLNT